MLSMFPPELFTGHKGTNNNTDLSEKGRAFIRKMYPKQARSQPERETPQLPAHIRLGDRIRTPWTWTLEHEVGIMVSPLPFLLSHLRMIFPFSGEGRGPSIFDGLTTTHPSGVVPG